MTVPPSFFILLFDGFKEKRCKCVEWGQGNTTLHKYEHTCAIASFFPGPPCRLVPISYISFSCCTCKLHFAPLSVFAGSSTSNSPQPPPERLSIIYWGESPKKQSPRPALSQTVKVETRTKNDMTHSTPLKSRYFLCVAVMEKSKDNHHLRTLVFTFECTVSSCYRSNRERLHISCFGVRPQGLVSTAPELMWIKSAPFKICLCSV